MEKVSVTIELDENVAEAYFRLSDTQKRRVEENIKDSVITEIEEDEAKFEVFASLTLKDGRITYEELKQIWNQAKQTTTSEILDDLHRQARANGLTDEIADALMNDD